MLQQAHGVYAPLDAETFKREFATWGWRPTFWKLARLAAVMANGKTADLRALTSDLLTMFRGSSRPAEREIATYVAASGQDAPIVNECAVYFLQAMTLLYGNESDAQPHDGTIAYWFLLANDHAFDWKKPDTRVLTLKESVLADMARAATFNQRRDPVTHFVRMYLTLSAAPPRKTTWSSADEWRGFLKDALGMTLEEYVEGLSGPLAIHSMVFGSDIEGTPTLNPKSWLNDTLGGSQLSTSFLEGLSLTRERATEMLRKESLSDQGLPVGPSLFYRFPFVRVSDDAVVAASPWVVAEQLRGGIWGKCITHAKAKYGDGGGLRWTRGFGDLFEAYCRRCISIAQVDTRFRDRVLLSETIGDETEIEDALFLDHDRVAFVSIKSSTMPEDRMKKASSASDVVTWFEDWLFAREEVREGRKYREGALRQLDKKITRLRRGEFEPQIPRGWQVFPVIVTYDELGADTIGMYRWVDERCRNEGILQQKRVRRLTFAHVNEFEQLLAIASRGVPVLDVLRKKTESDFAAEKSLSGVVREFRRGADDLRLAGLADQYTTLTNGVAMRLFGRTLER
jgi:hypothetical protein